MPVHDAIELACEALYASSNPPELQQPTFKKLMEIAVTNVWFTSGSDWYIQRDGVAMGASLAVILANVWLKNYEAQIAVENPAPQPPSLPRQKNLGYRCGGCEKMVAKNSYAIQCSTCRSWFQRKCAGLTLAEIKSLPSQTNWLCGCQLKDSTPIETPDAEVFGRYVDDILRSAKVSNIERILEVSNNLHPNSESTIETLKERNAFSGHGSALIEWENRHLVVPKTH